MKSKKLNNILKLVFKHIIFKLLKLVDAQVVLEAKNYA